MNCKICGQTFTKKKNLDQHSKIHSKHKPFQCSICPKRSHRKADKNRHEKIHAYKDPTQSRINFPIKRNLHKNLNAVPDPRNGDFGQVLNHHPQKDKGLM